MTALQFPFSCFGHCTTSLASSSLGWQHPGSFVLHQDRAAETSDSTDFKVDTQALNRRCYLHIIVDWWKYWHKQKLDTFINETPSKGIWQPCPPVCWWCSIRLEGASIPLVSHSIWRPAPKFIQPQTSFAQGYNGCTEKCINRGQKALIWRCHSWFSLQPNLFRIVLRPELNSGLLVSHGPLWTHVTNYL